MNPLGSFHLGQGHGIQDNDLASAELGKHSATNQEENKEQGEDGEMVD